MFLFIRDSQCQLHEFNMTRALHDEDYQSLEKQMLACICPISVLALCANALSLFVFLRQRWDNRAIRLVLLSVSVWEVLLQSAILLEAVLVFSGVKHSHTPASYVITSLLQVWINAATAVRNWNMVVLSVSRCELVWYPIPSRGQQLIFTMRRLKILLGVIVAAGLVLGCLARLEYIGVICENITDPEMGSVVMRPLLSGVKLKHLPQPPSPSTIDSMLTVELNFSNINFTQQGLLSGAAEPVGAPGLPSMALYTFQSLLPPLIIPFPTVLMLVKLRRARQVTRILQLSRSSNFQLPGSRADLRLLMRRSTSEQQQQQSSRSHSVRSHQQIERLSTSQSSSYAAQQYRTSVLVLALVLIFCLLESPTFLSTLSHYLLPRLDLLGHNSIFIVNILTVLDSLLNFFVYAAASSTFRQETKKALLCRPSPPPAHFILRTPKNSTVTPPNLAALQLNSCSATTAAAAAAAATASNFPCRSLLHPPPPSPSLSGSSSIHSQQQPEQKQQQQASVGWSTCIVIV